DLHLDFAALHWLPGALDYAREHPSSPVHGRNHAYYRQFVDFAQPEAAEDPVLRGLLYDPQTSGGLLMAVDPQRAETALAELHKRGVDARRIGEVRAGTGRIVVHP
ncbi:MAG: selenide, water dikinase SelD, partial [Anaerolineae bacterium]|nr:selenide, water dikinase SelD [Anaerolineae bacterium]